MSLSRVSGCIKLKCSLIKASDCAFDTRVKAGRGMEKSDQRVRLASGEEIKTPCDSAAVVVVVLHLSGLLLIRGSFLNHVVS